MSHISHSSHISHFIMKTHTRHLALAIALFLPTLLPAQQVTQPALETTGTAAPATGAVAPSDNPHSALRNPQSQDDEVVMLSVFNVTGENDQGYAAMNTTGGSRVATSLRDTAASIQPFTQEFLNDIGATTIDDIMSYAANVETDADDTNSSISSTESRGAGNNNNSFRIRGLGMTTVFDFIPLSFPIDGYNTERVEISSGPNSILFGISSGGGVATLSSSRANLQRNRLTVRNVLGTWTSPAVSGIPYYRATVDYNLVLAPRKAALRLLGLYQDGSGSSWRKYSMQHDRRINPVLALRPFPNTRIDLAYEIGRRKNSTSFNWNASDGLSQWLAFAETDPNHGIMQGFGANWAVPGTANIGNSIHLMFFENNATVYDLRRAHQSLGVQGNVGFSPNARLPENMSSIYYNPTGPGALRDQKFDRIQVVLEQSIGKLNLQFGYYHNQTNATAHAPGRGDVPLRADPNQWISTLEYNGTAGTVPNDYAGHFYIEDYWQITTLRQRYNAYRATAEYTLNLKTLGRHRIIANLERFESEQYNNRLLEILVDGQQQGIQNVTNPTSANNTLYRRHYVDKGDFSTYYAGDWRTPVEPFWANGQLYHATYASVKNAINHTKQDINSAGIVLQSFLFKDRLVTTLGIRVDDLAFKKEKNAPITDPLDPRILNKTKVLYETVYAGAWDRTVRSTPYTYTAGAVYHITDWLSPFVNFSSNRGAPHPDGRYVLPNGNLPPLTEGSTIDYGIRLDPLRNGKIILRLAHFDTKMLHDAVVSNANATDTNSSLGANNLYNIYDALHFLSVTDGTGLPPDGEIPAPGQLNAPWGAITLPNGATRDYGPNQGPMTAAQYAVTPPDAASKRVWGAPPLYTSGMVDQKVTGWEANLTANITKNFTLQASFSYQQRNRVGVFDEVLNYYNANIPKWRAMADPLVNGGKQYYVNVPGYGAYPLWEYIRNQLYGTPATTLAVNDITTTTTGAINPSGAGDGSVRANLNDMLYNYGSVVGNRPYKFNMLARYRFPNKSALKGFALGAGFRYQAGQSMPDPNNSKPNLGAAPVDADSLLIDPADYIGAKKTMTGQSLLFWDAFVTYKCKLFSGRTTMALQFNVQNLFNNDIETTSRITQSGQPTRVYINTPRALRLTATFDF